MKLKIGCFIVMLLVQENYARSFAKKIKRTDDLAKNSTIDDVNDDYSTESDDGDPEIWNDHPSQKQKISLVVSVQKIPVDNIEQNASVGDDKFSNKSDEDGYEYGYDYSDEYNNENDIMTKGPKRYGYTKNTPLPDWHPRTKCTAERDPLIEVTTKSPNSFESSVETAEVTQTTAVTKTPEENTKDFFASSVETVEVETTKATDHTTKDSFASSVETVEVETTKATDHTTKDFSGSSVETVEVETTKGETTAVTKSSVQTTTANQNQDGNTTPDAGINEIGKNETDDDHGFQPSSTKCTEKDEAMGVTKPISTTNSGVSSEGNSTISPDPNDQNNGVNGTDINGNDDQGAGDGDQSDLDKTTAPYDPPPLRDHPDYILDDM